MSDHNNQRVYFVILLFFSLHISRNISHTIYNRILCQESLVKKIAVVDITNPPNNETTDVVELHEMITCIVVVNQNTKTSASVIHVPINIVPINTVPMIMMIVIIQLTITRRMYKTLLLQSNIVDRDYY